MPAESVRLEWKSTGQAHLHMFGFSALVLNDEFDSRHIRNNKGYRAFYCICNAKHYFLLYNST